MAIKSKRGRMILTNLKCEECGNVFNIPRKRGELRDKGHTKHVWCFKCKKQTAHHDFINDYDIMGQFSLSSEEINELQT